MVIMLISGFDKERKNNFAWTGLIIVDVVGNTSHIHSDRKINKSNGSI